MSRYPVGHAVETQRGKGRTRDVSASRVYFETAGLHRARAPIRFTLVLRYAEPTPMRLGCAGGALRVNAHGPTFGVAASITSHWLKSTSP
jgi:hypothetical protein